VTITQTALERELLLVPAPESAVSEPRPPAGGEAPRQEEEESQGSEDPIPTGAVADQVRSALIMVAILTIGLVVQLALVSTLVHRSAQISMFNQFRTELALGTAPLSNRHNSLPLGTPIALISIPSIGVQQVVAEGTTALVLAKGPGHLRSTVFPGGAGSSAIFGRAAAFGGPFGHIDELHHGQLITVTTQVGRSVFRVVGVRYAGGKPIKVDASSAVLVLETASGASYVPSGVVSVYADKIGAPLASDHPPVHAVPPSQRPLGIDTGTLWALLLWLGALTLVLAGAVWTWHRRGHAQAWIVFGAPLALIWFFVADQATQLLPNLL
jgi:hypothetical protein